MMEIATHILALVERALIIILLLVVIRAQYKRG
jgi:hypothetical protein